MDFSEVDIPAFLRASIPVRFGDISPYDFEDFIAELFREDGYHVEPTSYSGDFGADLVVSKKRERTVVQVKRFAATTLVGVTDVNQVVGAREYYKANGALLITTSGFTAAAISLARSAGCVLWDWERLERYICDVFLDGQSYHDVFDAPTQSGDEEVPFALHFLRMDPEARTGKGTDAIAVHLGLENHSDENVYVHLELPLIITRKQRQVTAVEWREDYFNHGLVVSGATCEPACYFLQSQLPEIRSGDRVVLRVYVQGHAEPYMIEQKIGHPPGKCYFVTFCYGRGSGEHMLMTRLRDEVLETHFAGRLCVQCYYLFSPLLIACIQRRYPGWWLLKQMVAGTVKTGLAVARRLCMDTPVRSK